MFPAAKVFGGSLEDGAMSQTLDCRQFNQNELHTFQRRKYYLKVSIITQRKGRFELLVKKIGKKVV